MNRRLLLVSLLTAAATPLVEPAVAVEVPRSCTVVGTAQADVLHGTPGAEHLAAEATTSCWDVAGRTPSVAGQVTTRCVADGDPMCSSAPGAETISMVTLAAIERGRCRWRRGAYDVDDVRFRSCTFDQEDPVIREVVVLTPTVDVSQGSQDIVIRVHVTDDSQHYIESATLHDSLVDGAMLRTFDEELVAGDGSDGWWELRRTVPRGFPPSRLRLSIRAEDVAGRYVHFEKPFAVTVADHDPVPLPQVSLLRPGTDRVVDTTSSSQHVTVSARVVGMETAVVPRGVALCLEHVASVVLEHCARSVELVSGNRWDGVWRGEVALRPTDLPGEWSPVIKVADTARPDEPFDHVGRWGGGRRWNVYGAPWALLQPSGVDSVVTVSGAAPDATPEFVSASLPEGTVTRPQSDETHQLPLEVEVTDGGGTPLSSVAVHLVPLDQGVQLHGGGPVLTRAGDGQWDGILPIRATTTPGRYALIVAYRDGNHLRYHGGESARVATHLPLLPLPGDSDPIISVQ